MKHLYLIPLLCLPLVACDNAADHDYSSRATAKNEYKVTVKGKPGESIEELKQTLKTRSKKLCGNDRVFLLRGIREETYGSFDTARYHTVYGDVECVDMNYFANSPVKIKKPKK